MGLLGDILDKTITKSRKAERWEVIRAEIEREDEEEYQKFTSRFMDKADTEMQASVILHILQEMEQRPHAERDYAVLGQLPDYYKDSISMGYFTSLLKDKTYYECTYAFYVEKKSLVETMRMLQPLKDIKEIKDEINYSLKHYGYLLQDGQDIRSVLTDENDIEGALQRMKEGKNFSQEERENGEKIMLDMMDDSQKLRELHDKNEYQEMFNMFSKAKYEEWIFDYLKKFLLCIAVQENSSSTVTDSYDFTKNFIDGLFQASRVEEILENEDFQKTYKMIRIPITDMIIADAIRYNKAGMIDNINEDLEKFLKYFPVKKEEADISQFEVLRKIFAMLKAYKQEKMVLESMINHNIPRADFQEKRLAFLRNSSMLGSGINLLDKGGPKIIEGESNQEGMVFDYRSMTWNESDITVYLNRLSAEDKILKTPMVVDEWSDNLNTNNIEWNQEEFSRVFAVCLKENFGDKYLQKNVRSGVLIEGAVDYEDSLLISEDQSKAARYPWLHFLLSTEKLTLNQALFSIYILYDPNDDYRDERDIFKRNAQIANRIICLKLRQNPKINNYISVMKNIIIEELERYLNTTSNEETIY